MQRYVFIAAFFAVSFAYAHDSDISRVWEYCPAPGQFVNALPEYEAGDDADDMRLKAEESLSEHIEVTLGGWGGYIVFGFDHMVVNKPGANDLVIMGNAFYDLNGYTLNGRHGGSCEPGIVMVSYDANGNGKPDDEWYELAGSEYTNPQTVHDYAVTYYQPSKAKDKVAWEDNKGKSGFINRTAENPQPYYPQWITAGSMHFTGSRLPDNYVDESGNGTYFVLYSYPWGYADNHPNTSASAQLNIEWAVRADGTPANLPGIHFVKVYTALNQQCGWMGESSTEISGAQDLHPDAVTGIDEINHKSEIINHKCIKDGQLYIIRGKQQYTLTGSIINN